MAATVVQIRMDEDLKDQASAVLDDLGLDLPTAIRMFLKKVIAREGIPFEVAREDTPNPVTIAAMREAEEIMAHPERYKSYSSIAEMVQDLDMEAEGEDDV